MDTLISDRKNLPDHLVRSIFVDRGHQFVGRLKWDLCVTPNGYETDEYDDCSSKYLAVHRLGEHLGSCRVRPITSSTMITDHFHAVFPSASEFLRHQKGRLYELTRFCRSPVISVDESRLMLGLLARLLDSFRDQYNLSGFVAIVFPQVARFLDTIGVRYVVVSKSQMDGRTVLLICITHAEKVEQKAKYLPSEAKILRTGLHLVA
ncbi:MAG: acyl-homoserine-lactone synthase [Halioglobus sp.]